MRDTSLKPFLVTGETLVVKGRQLVSFTLGGRKLVLCFWYVPFPTEAVGPIGAYFIEKAGAESALSVAGWRWQPSVRRRGVKTVSQLKLATFMLFSEVEAGHSPRPTI